MLNHFLPEPRPPQALTFLDNMPPPSAPPSAQRSMESKDWVLVDKDFATGVHTKARTPQRNDDNMSSRQVADASTDGSYQSVVVLLGEDADVHPRSAATVPHRPESNGGSSSTETAGTDNTLVGIRNAAGHHAGLAPTPYTHSEPTYPMLTSHNMALHQRMLDLPCPGNVAGWVDSAGLGDRLIRSRPSSVAHSMLTVASSMSGPRGGGSRAAGPVVFDWLLVLQPLAVDDALAAAGAWSDKPLEPFLRRLSVLSVDDE